VVVVCDAEPVRAVQLLFGLLGPSIASLPPTELPSAHVADAKSPAS
jgi:hypothetical protein